MVMFRFEISLILHIIKLFYQQSIIHLGLVSPMSIVLYERFCIHTVLQLPIGLLGKLWTHSTHHSQFLSHSELDLSLVLQIGLISQQHDRNVISCSFLKGKEDKSYKKSGKEFACQELLGQFTTRPPEGVVAGVLLHLVERHVVTCFQLCCTIYTCPWMSLSVLGFLVLNYIYPCCAFCFSDLCLQVFVFCLFHVMLNLRCIIISAKLTVATCLSSELLH